MHRQSHWDFERWSPRQAVVSWLAVAVLGLGGATGCSADTSSSAMLDDQRSPEGTDRTGADDGTDDSASGSPQGDGPPLPGDSSGTDPGETSDPTFASEDGDSIIVGGCEVEPCIASETPPDCGDGTLTEDEACDDGNLTSGDGCAANCLATEPGFSCAAPGRPCQVIARCGDGLVASSEQCDDGNSTAGDGCSARCRVEQGKKCEGEPSSCSDTTCGDGIKEGAESCDDGNLTPFDGCSPVCEREPNCTDTGCTSDCGDGMVINEDCDDGNQIDGDGCSADCEIEQGFSCAQATPECERVAEQCVLRVPVIYRDFSEAHPDFANLPCNELALGALLPALGPDRRPRMSGDEASTRACLSSDENFADWYSDTEHSLTVVRELLLFDNGAGGYVNRFGAMGERFEAIDPASEKVGGTSLSECTETCRSHAQNGEQPMFDSPLRCDDECRPLEQAASDLVSGELSALEGDLNRASDAVPRDETLIAEIEAEISDVESQLVELEAAVVGCETECASELDARVEVCAATCSPCGSDPERFCIGGEAESFDGTPLFFPLDDIAGDTANRAPALIPQQYGYSNWPWEQDIFPDASDHNFFFTSEVRHWFRYDETTRATLDFLGDDDVWVFVNGQLVVDLGGIHAPALGSVTIDAATGRVISDVSDGMADGYQSTNDIAATDLGLQLGNVYEVAIFHAERQLDGSSFKLTLSGFEAEPSECAAICGDAILSFGEECDDGNNDGGYGECEAGCVLGPFCGDGIVQAEFGEDCDDGPAGTASCPGCRELRVRVR